MFESVGAWEKDGVEVLVLGVEGKCIKGALPTCESCSFISGEILPPSKKEQAILKGRKENIF